MIPPFDARPASDLLASSRERCGAGAVAQRTGTARALKTLVGTGHEAEVPSQVDGGDELDSCTVLCGASERSVRIVYAV